MSIDPRPTGWLWKLSLWLSFAVVMAVNFGFLYIAVAGADPVVASYEAEAR